MLVRISCDVEKHNNTYKLKCKLPTIYLDSYNYNLSLRQIICELNIDRNLSDAYKISPLLVFSLRTTCIDQTAVNPMQEIALFTCKKGSNYIVYEPKHLREYKIQNIAIHTSEFSINLLNIENTGIIIKKADLLLAITPHARF